MTDTMETTTGAVMTELGGGWYEITCPGLLPEGEKLHGVAKAEARVNELNAELAADAADAEGFAPMPNPELAQSPAPTSVAVPRQFTGKLDPSTKQALKAQKGVTFTRIVLEDNDDIPPTGLPIGHNGRFYVIKTGEEVDVPDFLIGVLNDAKMASPILDSDKRISGWRNRSKYPYTVVR